MIKCEWIFCPVCGNKTRLKIRDDTVLKNFPLYCPKCKQENLISVHKLNIRTAQIFHLLLAVISNRQNRRKALKSLGLLRNQNHPKLSSFIRCYP